MPNKVEKLADGSWLVEGELGEKFTGEVDAILPTMIESQQNTKKAYQAKTQRVDELEQEIQRLKAEHSHAANVTPPPTPDQLQARSWMTNELAQDLGLKDREELKRKFAQLDSVTQKNDEKLQRLEMERKVLMFKSDCPDYPDTPEASEKMLAMLGKMGYDANTCSPDAFAAAHSRCKELGHYKPISNEEWVNSMQAANSRGGAAPPMIRSSSPDTHAPIDLWNEPLDKQRERIIREQLAGGR